MIRRAGAIAAGILVVVASVLGLAGPASAHNFLVSSVPKSGQTLTELPPRWIITTNEGLLDLGGKGRGFSLNVRGPDGLYYGSGCVTVTGPSMSVAAEIGAPGKYTVIWQIVSADGHIVSAEYPFTWAPATTTTPSEGTKSPANCHGTTGGTAASGSSNAAPATTASTADLTDVVWIGGAVLVVGAAVVVTLMVAGRKRTKKRA